MSNKIVPSTYRSLIEDVVSTVKDEFHAWGVDESVLRELHQLWHDKVMHSNVADFELPQGNGGGGMAATQNGPQPSFGVGQAPIKPEPSEYPHVQLPPGGPAPPPGMLPLHRAMAHAGQPGGRPMSTQQIPYMMTTQQQSLLGISRAAPPRPVSADRIPQVDGPSRGPGASGSSNMPASSHPSLPPTSHPSLPPSAYAPPAVVPPAAKPKPARSHRADPASDAINSDLDDSDEEEDNDDEADGTVQDIVFCTYDKVARVKNKWKTTLKDGIIHVNGRDYLFSKCNGEFEW